MWKDFLWINSCRIFFPQRLWKSFSKFTEGLWIKNALITRLFGVFPIYFPLLLLLLPNIL